MGVLLIIHLLPPSASKQGTVIGLVSVYRGGGSGTASMAMAIPIFEVNNYGCGILWLCFLMSMCSVQHGLITE